MIQRRTIDLNADLGEYTGLSGASRDTAILDVVTSANIACGVHAGDREVMQRTVDAAFSRGVAVGAHPSFPDREGFGRREMKMSAAALSDEIASQVEALGECCTKAGARLQYVKPHGALYNLATREEGVARVIAEAVRRVDASLVLLGLFGSPMIDEGERAALIVATEGFPDRGYLADGTRLVVSPDSLCIHGDNPEALELVRATRDALEASGLIIASFVK
jgi:UPF0271 protein